jgi:hypothetical protein
MPARTVASARQRINEGFQFLDIASDLRLLDVAARDVLQGVKAD